MTRPLLAWVPVRGTFWSGIRGGCVTHWRIDGRPISTIAISTLAILDEGSWLPGAPSEIPPRSLSRIPTIDEGMPLKNWADVFVKDSAGLRRRSLVLHIESTKIEDALTPEPGFTDRSFLRDRASLKLDRDLETFQLAPPRRRAELFGEGATIGWDIDGTHGPVGPLDFTVGALVHFKDEDVTFVEMICDSVYIDVERREIELVWRGLYLDPTWGAEVERILIGALPVGLEEDQQAELLGGGLPRAVFTLAATNDDIKACVAPPPLREEEIAMARLSSWENGPGAPVLSADEFALISSEISSGPKAEVLGAHGFDEIAWGLEEWAQGERVANESAELPDDLGDEAGGGDIEVKPARTRARPHKRLDIADYARISAHLEVRDPARVLAEAKLSVGELLDIEETMSEAMETNEGLAAEFDRLLPTYRDEAAKAHAGDLMQLGFDPEEEISTS
jgi:hypothetical protein